jgi:hypothetical protein
MHNQLDYKLEEWIAVNLDTLLKNCDYIYDHYSGCSQKVQDTFSVFVQKKLQAPDDETRALGHMLQGSIFKNPLYDQSYGTSRPVSQCVHKIRSSDFKCVVYFSCFRSRAAVCFSSANKRNACDGPLA